MTAFDIMNSAIPAVTLPVNPGEALLGILAALAIAIGVFSLVHATSRVRKRQATDTPTRTALAAA